MSPQGGPKKSDVTVQNLHATLLTFLYYFSSEDEDHGPRLPREVVFKICRYCLPPLKILINQIPLHALQKHTLLLDKDDKEELVQALTKRHMNKIKRSLNTKLRIKGSSYTPMTAANTRGHTKAATLLDPKATGNFESKIKEKYKKLLA